MIRGAFEERGDEVRTHWRRVVALALIIVLPGCAQTAGSAGEAGSTRPSKTDASPSSSESVTKFPTAVFADISEGPVSKGRAAQFQTALREMADGAGMAATVMSPDGT